MMDDSSMWSVGGSSFSSVSPNIDILAFSRRLESVLVEGCGNDDDSLAAESEGSSEEFFAQQNEEDEREILELYPVEGEDDKEILEVYPMQQATVAKNLSSDVQQIPNFPHRLLTQSAREEQPQPPSCSGGTGSQNEQSAARIQNVVTLLQEAITTAADSLSGESTTSLQPMPRNESPLQSNKTLADQESGYSATLKDKSELHRIEEEESSTSLSDYGILAARARDSTPHDRLNFDRGRAFILRAP
jgi:myosin heavy subunit